MSESASEFYVASNTLPVKFNAALNNPGTSPFKKELPVIAVNQKVDGVSNYQVISRDAGRSIEDFRVGKRVVWSGDLSGDIYGDRDQKGGRFEKTFKLTFNQYNGGWRVEGMQTYIPQELAREELASIVFRQLGLPTDVVRSVHVITGLPDVQGKYFGMDKWKNFAIKNFAERYKNSSDKDEKITSATNWLYGQEFCIEERDLQVAERLRSLGYCQTESEFNSMFKPILKWVNIATESKKSGLITGTAQPEHFNDTDSDFKRYFSEWLPSQMGVFLGRLHKNQMVHRNASAQNWSAVGTLYDKDTVTGVLMGEKIPTSQEYASDLQYTLGALDELGGNFLSGKLGKEAVLSAKVSFLKNYLQEKYGNRADNYVLSKSVIYSRILDKDSHRWVKVVIPESDWKIMEDLGLKTK